jgi:hypothetical protein
MQVSALNCNLPHTFRSIFRIKYIGTFSQMHNAEVKVLASYYFHITNKVTHSNDPLITLKKI